MLLRRLHTSLVVNAFRTKVLIDNAVLKKRILVKSEDIERKLLKKQKDFNNSPVKNASAQSLLSKLLGREFPDNEPIGPHTQFTTKELLSIFEQNNVRLIYKVLGTSGRQIQDSLLVDQDVKKLLKKGELLKAKQLAKMARYQGIFAYGTIIEYLMKKGQVNDSFEIFMDLKKRGYTLGGRLYNILLSAYGDILSKKGKGLVDISNEKIEILYRSFQKDHESNNNEISIIHVNSLLKVLRRGQRFDLAINLYDSLKEVRSGKSRLKPDIRTYTEMFRVMALYKPNDVYTYNEIINKVELIFFNAQHNVNIKIDHFLMRAYASIFAYSDDLKLRARSVAILREWFRVCTIEDIKQEIDITKYSESMWSKIQSNSGTKKVDTSKTLKLLPRDEINFRKEKRFEPDDSVLRMYTNACRLFKIPFKYQPKNDTNVANKEAGRDGDKGAKPAGKPSQSQTESKQNQKPKQNQNQNQTQQTQ